MSDEAPEGAPAEAPPGRENPVPPVEADLASDDEARRVDAAARLRALAADPRCAPIPSRGKSQNGRDDARRARPRRRPRPPLTPPPPRALPPPPRAATRPSSSPRTSTPPCSTCSARRTSTRASRPRARRTRSRRARATSCASAWARPRSWTPSGRSSPPRARPDPLRGRGRARRRRGRRRGRGRGRGRGRRLRLRPASGASSTPAAPGAPPVPRPRSTPPRGAAFPRAPRALRGRPRTGARDAILGAPDGAAAMTRDLRPLVGLLLPEGPPRGAKSDAVRSKAARLVAALARSAHGRAALCREEERREEGTEAGAEAEAFAEAEASDDDALPGALAASLRSTDPAFASLRGTCARLVASLAPRESSTIAAAAGNVVPPSPSFAASLFARGAVPSLCVLLEDPAASEDARERRRRRSRASRTRAASTRRRRARGAARSRRSRRRFPPRTDSPRRRTRPHRTRRITSSPRRSR